MVKQCLPCLAQLVKQCQPCLVQLVQHSDREVLADACWALFYLTDGTNDKIQCVVDYDSTKTSFYKNAACAA